MNKYSSFVNDKNYNKALQFTQEEPQAQHTNPPPYEQVINKKEPVLSKINQISKRPLYKDNSKTVSLERVSGKPVVDIDPGERSFAQFSSKQRQNSRPTREERNCQDRMDYYLNNQEQKSFNTRKAANIDPISIIEEIRGFQDANGVTHYI